MRELDLPDLIRDRVVFYNILWGKKVRKEDLSSFSHLVSDDFARKIVIEPMSGNLYGLAEHDRTKGKMIITDKKRGLNLVAEIEGDLEDLRDNIDSDKRNKEVQVFDFCSLHGVVSLETPSLILEGFYREGKHMGGFYEKHKANSLFTEKGVKDGTIIHTIRQVYDAQGRRHGIWYTQNASRRESIAYKHGELTDAHEVTYFTRPKTRSQKLIGALLSIGVVAKIAKVISKRRGLNALAADKVRTRQDR